MTSTIWGDRLRNLPQYLLPQRLLTRLTYRLTRVRTPWFKNALIQQVARKFRVNLSEALEPNPRAYPDFNAFFTRALKPGARPIAPGDRVVCCPVDGAVSQIGLAESDTLLQAKGRSFSNGRGCFRAARSPRCICRRATITASTCRWLAGCGRWFTFRASCSACRR